MRKNKLKNTAKTQTPLSIWLQRIANFAKSGLNKTKSFFAKIRKRKLATMLTIFIVLPLLLVLIAGFSFLRQRQLCTYQELIDKGRASASANVDLCPNIFDTGSWGRVIANAFNPFVLHGIQFQTDNMQTIAAEASACTDQLNPLCWAKGSKPVLKQDDGFTNLLLVGLDTRPNTKGGLKNTDSIMVVSMDNVSGKVLLISLPRDLQIYFNSLSGKKLHNKINAIYASGGVDEFDHVVAQIIGKPIHYYAYIHFTTFLTLIDKMGGLDITLDKPFADAYPCSDVPKGRTCPSPRFITDGTFGLFKFPAGPNHFDSFQALVYSRAREYSTDYARAARQQQVFKALMYQSLHQNLSLTDRINLYSELYDLLHNEVLTNISTNDIAAVVSIMDKISADPARVVADPQLGGSGKIIYVGADSYSHVVAPQFRDPTFHQFQQFISRIWEFLPYYIEHPKVLIKYSAGSLPNAEKMKKLLDQENPFWEVKTVNTDQQFTGIHIYDLSNGTKAGSIRDLQSNLPGSLIYNAKLDKITQSSYGEDILIVVGQDKSVK